MLHLFERFFIHIFSAPGVAMTSFFLFYFLGRKVKQLNWIISSPIALRYVSALVPVFLIFLREPFDVANDDMLLKSYTDFISWLIGVGLWLWGSHRFFWVMAHLYGVENYVRSVLNVKNKG